MRSVRHSRAGGSPEKPLKNWIPAPARLRRVRGNDPKEGELRFFSNLPTIKGYVGYWSVAIRSRVL
jgi:hypothetical protein